MEKVYKRESFSAEETFAIGKELAAQAKPGEVYCLSVSYTHLTLPTTSRV